VYDDSQSEKALNADAASSCQAMSTRLGTIVAVAAIALAGVVAYHNSLNCAFVFDDDQVITENPHVRSLWPLGPALTAPPQSAAAGRPLLCLSLAVNYHLGGLDPWGYHVFNILVHILAGWTLFGIVRRSLLHDCLRDTFGRDAAMLAAVCAIVWVVHPLQTESVTYTVQRAESMMGFFYLLTLYCAIRGFDAYRPDRWYVAAVAACLLGMATKEVMVTAPVLVLLYDRVFRSDSMGAALRRRGLLYIGLAATWIVLATQVAGGPRSASAGFGVEGLTPLAYAKSQFGVILHYMRLAFWPDALCLDYAWPVVQDVRQFVPPLIVVVLFLIATAWLLKRRSPLGYLGAWFFLILAPSSSIIPIADLAFEHRMYLPLAAMVVFVVLTVYLGSRRLATRLQIRRPVCFSVAVLFALVAVVALTARTIVRNRDYRSPVAMWTNVVRQRPTHARAHNNLATVLRIEGNLSVAIDHLRRALTYQPDYADAHNNLALALVATGGDLVEAIDHYDKALALRSDWPEAHNNRGLALAAAGRDEDAVKAFQKAVDLAPGFVEARRNLIAALARLEQRSERRVEDSQDFERPASAPTPHVGDAARGLGG
jgi:tetratricopeptide (TPR) repeat protein